MGALGSVCPPPTTTPPPTAAPTTTTPCPQPLTVTPPIKGYPRNDPCVTTPPTAVPTYLPTPPAPLINGQSNGHDGGALNSRRRTSGGQGRRQGPRLRLYQSLQSGRGVGTGSGQRTGRTGILTGLDSHRVTGESSRNRHQVRDTGNQVRDTRNYLRDSYHQVRVNGHNIRVTGHQPGDIILMNQNRNQRQRDQYRGNQDRDRRNQDRYIENHNRDTENQDRYTWNQDRYTGYQGENTESSQTPSSESSDSIPDEDWLLTHSLDILIQDHGISSITTPHTLQTRVSSSDNSGTRSPSSVTSDRRRSSVARSPGHRVQVQQEAEVTTWRPEEVRLMDTTPRVARVTSPHSYNGGAR